MADIEDHESPNKAIDDGTDKQSPAELRREFIKKYGKLAAVTPLALMLAMNSQAQDSEGGGDGGPF